MEKSYYKLHAEVQGSHWWFVTKKEIVLTLIRRFVIGRKNHAILDIGCGCGLMLPALSSIGETFGIDADDDALAYSRATFQGNVEKGSLPNKLPYEGKQFSIVTALDVIEHLDDDEAALVAIFNKLDLGGHAIITVPAFMFLWSKHDELNLHRRRYTYGELLKKLQNAGFSIEKISYYNTLLFPLIYTHRLLERVLGLKGVSDVEKPLSLVNQILRFIFKLEAIMLPYVNFPFGVSLIAVVKKGDC